MSGLANTDSRQKLRKKGDDEKLNHTFPFPTQQEQQRGAGPPDPNYRSQQPTGLPPPGPLPPGHFVTYHPREIGPRGWGDSGTRRMEGGVSIVKELVGSRYGVECE